MVIKYELITVTISQNVLKYSFALKSIIPRVMIRNVLSLFIKTPIIESLLFCCLIIYVFKTLDLITIWGLDT